VNGKHWKGNAGIQKFIRDRGLKDEAGLQAYFNRRVETIVRKHGKKMMGWDEVLHPDLPRDVLVQSWRDHESLAKAIKQGHRTLLSFGYYLDHLDTSKVYYQVDPLGGPASGLSEAEAARVLGGEACMWTEFVSPETVDSRIWPMTASIAAFEGQIGQVAYSAAKAGIAGMTLTMARDLGGLGIRVVTIAPSLFNTGLTQGIPKEMEDGLTKDAAFPKRMGRPEEYAHMAKALFENPMVNGLTLRLDGGQRFAPK